MYDMHYDLLSYLYKNKGNIIENIYYNNIKGGIINLYFMDLPSMKKELNMSEYECFDLINTFKKSLSYLDKFKKEKGINPKFIYSIEGCSYLDINDLEELYNLGLRSIMITWNYDNKYGGGAKGCGRLTSEGKLLIKKAIELNMIIDLSHANEKTFNDIIELLNDEQKNGNKVNVIASHSNVFTLNNNKRNLKDYQIKNLINLGGKIGLVCYLPFLDSNYNINTNEENLYSLVKHINYLINDLGLSKKDICISTDDMAFIDKEFYYDTCLFELQNFNKQLRDYLLNYFIKDDIDLFLETNPLEVINKVKN